jgi:hypothetical protein
MPTNGTRNRNAGHSWERENAEDFRVFYPQVATSRSCNRARDAQKVDLAYADEHKYGRFPYNVQSKNYSKSVLYPKLLSEMPQEDGILNVVLHKQTQKVNGRFMARGKYAILNYEDFFKLVVYRKAYEAVLAYIDFVPDEERKELENTLKELGL